MDLFTILSECDLQRLKWLKLESIIQGQLTLSQRNKVRLLDDASDNILMTLYYMSKIWNNFWKN